MTFKGSLPLLSKPAVPGAAPYNPYDSINSVNVNDLSTMSNEWLGIEYAELSVLLVHLKHLQMMHQTHHWICCGDPFYGDHILFQRLYEAINDDIDSIAEKAVGLGSERNVEPIIVAKQLSRLMNACSPLASIPSSHELAYRSLKLEQAFVLLVKQVSQQLASRGALSYGLDNLLAQLADDHEKNVYLLKQRCGSTR